MESTLSFGADLHSIVIVIYFLIARIAIPEFIPSHANWSYRVIPQPSVINEYEHVKFRVYLTFASVSVYQDLLAIPGEARSVIVVSCMQPTCTIPEILTKRFIVIQQLQTSNCVHL